MRASTHRHLHQPDYRPRPATKSVAAHEWVQAGVVTLLVWGMDCPTCALRVRDALLGVEGVLTVHIALERGLAFLHVDPLRAPPEALVAALSGAGEERHHYAGRILSSL